MSNINQNNFNNCFNLRLSNSDYWDLFLCTDCGCGLDHESILEACLIIDIDVDVDKCASGDTLCSLVSWSGDSCFESLSVPTTGLTLYDIGLTGIDNGFIKYDCNASTTSTTFIDTYTGSTYTIGSGDTNFCFTKVTGCTYDYSSRFITSANTVGRYVELCGGFYQGFFKLSDRTFYKEMPDNMFVWPISWFTCPPDCPPVSASTGTTGSTCCGQCNSGCGCGDSNPLFIPGSTGACNGCGNSNCQVCNTPLDNGTGGCGPWCKECGEPNSCNCKGSITAITVTEKYITGVTVNESYSKKGIVPEDEWIQLAIRFCAYEGYPLDEISNVPRRKGRLDFVTHKGNKVFHKGRHYQKKMRAPYQKFPTKKKLVLVMPPTPPANPFSLMN